MGQSGLRRRKWKAKPRWDRHQRLLRWGTITIREFRREAPSQMAVLDAFQARRWPQRINVHALAPVVGGKRWVMNVVKNLNRESAGIRFHADGPNHCISYTLV